MSDTTYGYTSKHNRFWEIDLLRTLAIVTMILFHALYVPNYLGIAHTRAIMPPGFWQWVPRMAPGTFIFLAGVSLTISHARSKRMSGFLLRGLKIFAWGMAITVITWLISRTEYVQFGILHFFGVAFMLGPFFLRFRFINLILGIALLAIGIYLRGTSFDFPWLFWLGLRPHGYRAMEYAPLLPWFGILLLGMFFGKTLYPQGNRRFNIPEFSNPAVPALTLPGRHPLVIYIAHWPIILGALFVLYPDKLLPYVREALSYLPF